MEKQSKLTFGQIIAITAAVVVSVALALWINFSSDIEDIRFNSEPVDKLYGKFTVTLINASGESTIETELPARFNGAKAGDIIRITTTLSASELNGRYIAFYRQQTWADVYLDGELMLEADRDPELPFPMSAGSRWYIFKLPQDVEGKELCIELTSQFDKYAPIVPKIISGSKSAIVYMILHNARFPILIGVPTITLGAICILLGLLYKKRFNGRVILLGMLAMDISVWYLLESRISQVLFGNIALFSFVLFACHYGMPLLATALLLTFETFNKHKFTHVLFWLSLASFIGIHIVQILGLAYYIEMVAVVHVLLILIILDVLLSFIHEKKSRKLIAEIYVYKAFLILSVFAVIDLIGFYLLRGYLVGTFTEVGLLVFIVYLIYTACRKYYETEIDIAKNEIYHELAVKDLMIGLANRTAFEQEMSRLREASSPEEAVYFLFADVNNLKAVNDTYGHDSGDDCLVNTARLLRECFCEPSICYRIGGDEFCVICRGLNDKDIDARIEQLYSQVKSVDDQTVYPYSIACGYHIIDDEGADNCLKKADAMMYQEKMRFKNKG